MNKFLYLNNDLKQNLIYKYLNYTTYGYKLILIYNTFLAHKSNLYKNTFNHIYITSESLLGLFASLFKKYLLKLFFFFKFSNFLG